MSKSKIFLIFSLSFIGGIASASFYYPRIFDAIYLYFLLILAVSLLAINHRNSRMVVFSLTLAIFILGIFLVNQHFWEISELDLDGQSFSGEVSIKNEPEQNGARQKIIVSAQKNQKNFKILVNSFDGVAYSFGERIWLECLLKIPQNNFKGNEFFDYRMYLAKDGIFYECQKPKIKALPEGKKQNKEDIFLATVFGIKNKFKEKIEKNIPSPEDGLLAGLLLGGDDMLSEEWQEKFSITGMTHIVAVSGYNVAIIAEYLMLVGIFLGLWRKQAFWFAIFGIVFFVIMIGFPPSAARAGVMGTLLLWAAKNGRLANSQNSIVLAGVIMLFFNPLLLRYDIGFQLSFFATLGIVYLYPFLEQTFIKKNKTFGILEILLLTLAAQIFVLPIILYNFGNLSLVSPLANVLVLPIIPLAMFLGFFATMFAFIWEPLAVLFAYLAYLPLKYETLIIDFLAGVKYASFELRLSWWAVVIWYIILVIVCFWGAKKQKIARK